MNALEILFRIAPHLAEGARPAETHIMIRCPFHGGGTEKTPSCAVSTWKPVWFCHGCKESGHIAQLLSKYGLGRDAINALLPRVQYAKPETVQSKLTARKNPFKGDFTLDEGMLDAYRTMPTALERAGFSVSTMRHFEVGFDVKNTRITYPLRNTYGDLIGISGRTLWEGEEPRYRIYREELINRTEWGVPEDYTMEHAKKSLLWHAHVVRPFFFRGESSEMMIVTEGFKACMWTFQSGFEDVVALVGSYMTGFHAELIVRASNRCVLFLDNNEAGETGTRVAARALMNRGCEVYVADYPDEREQPDDLSYDEVYEALMAPMTYRAWLSAHPEPIRMRKRNNDLRFAEAQELGAS